MLVASTPHHRSAALALGFVVAAAAVCIVAGPASFVHGPGELIAAFLGGRVQSD